MRKVIVLLAVVTFLGGCITMPKTYEIHNYEYFSANYDKLWTATMQVLAESNYPIRTNDKSSGVITTDYISMPSNEIRNYAQYSRPLLDMSARYNLNIIISKSGDMNVLKINSNLDAWEQVGYNPGYWESRPSNGNIESMLFSRIRTKILELR